MPGPKRIDPVFLETPRGLLTPAGTLFRTSRQRLDENYEKVLASTELEDLVYRAELWLESHRTVAVWLVPIMLLKAPVVWTFTIGVIVFLVRRMGAPSLGNHTLARAFEWLGWVPLQMLCYVIVLSSFGAGGDYERFLVGLFWFVLIRWRVLDFISRPLTNKLAGWWYPLPLPDQMLRAVIISEAIRQRVPLDGFPSIARWFGPDDSEDG